MLDIFPKVTIVFLTQLFCNVVCNFVVSLSLLHFLRANLNLLRDNFIIVKTSPCLGLLMSGMRVEQHHGAILLAHSILVQYNVFNYMFTSLYERMTALFKVLTI